jgi:hypothetical protein
MLAPLHEPVRHCRVDHGSRATFRGVRGVSICAASLFVALAFAARASAAPGFRVGVAVKDVTPPLFGKAAPP